MTVKDSTDDALLIRADRTLSSLGTVVDHRVLTEYLRSRDPRVHSARVSYLRYKPGTAVLAALHIRDDDGERLAVAHGVGPAGRGKLEKLQATADRAGLWCHLDAGAGLAIADAGADRHLPGLHRQLRHGGVTTLRYKPARRWVGYRESADGPALIKVYARGRAEHGAMASRALATAGVPGPELLESNLKRDTLRFAWAPGTSLDDPSSADLHAVGTLLAGLHRVPWPAADQAGSVTALGTNGTGIDALAAASPVLHAAADAAAQLQTRLGRLLDVDGLALVTSHGDFSVDQVLFEPGGDARILDTDSLALTPRETDLGTWVGEALARRCTPGTDPHEVAEAVLADNAPLITGYRDHADVEVRYDRILAIAATELINRASEPFRLRHPQWISAATARIALAVHVAARAGAPL